MTRRVICLDQAQQLDLGQDDQQCMIRRRKGAEGDSEAGHCAISRWEGKWYIGSHKDTLAEFISGERPPLSAGRGPRIVLASAAVSSLVVLPATFLG